MKVKDIYKLLLLLPVMTACQSEEALIADNTEAPSHKLTVRAMLPGQVESRTYITYGNQDTTCEFFRWQAPGVKSIDDCITIFNVSQLSQYGKVELNAIKVDGNYAEFESIENVNPEEFQVKKGDIIFANYWDANKYDKGAEIMFEITKGNKPQIIVDDPTADNYMTYMQGGLKMYDIVKAEEDDKIPDIHFKHLSAILRVTLRNETGHELFPKSLKFDCPGKAPFIVSDIYCGVDTESSDGSRLIIYDESEYSGTVTGDINNYTAAETEKGTFISAGKSYDLYVPVVPRVDNDIVVDRLIITLEDRDSSSSSDLYELSIDPFGAVFQAGMRYWFNLTAVEENGERKLMFTNQWLKQHPEQTPADGEETPRED